MPLGTGAKILDNLPGVKYTIDPQTFFANTAPDEDQAFEVPIPGSGATLPLVLPKQGIVSHSTIQFVGQLVVATASVQTSDQWPYNFLSNLNVSINGAADLWNVSGIALRQLMQAMSKGWVDNTDVFPGGINGGGSIAVGTYPISLTWEVPHSIDPTSLVGSLFAQSDQSNITYKLTQAETGALLSAAADATITGNFTLTPRTYEIPTDSSGALILPDLSMLHGMNNVDFQFNGTGAVRAPLVRSTGQLERLFVSVRSNATTRLSASGSAAADVSIDAIALTYGLNKVPLRYNPASVLLAKNNKDYGSPLPYDYLCFDTLVSNPIRDAIVMAGLTDLAVLVTVNNAVVVTAGSVSLDQEVLF